MAQAFTPSGANAAGANATPAAQAAGALTAGVTQITLPKAPVGVPGASMRIAVDGGTGMAWCWGTNANLTLSNGVFMAAGSVEVFGASPGETTISVIGASAAGTCRVHMGQGT